MTVLGKITPLMMPVLINNLLMMVLVLHVTINVKLVIMENIVKSVNKMLTDLPLQNVHVMMDTMIMVTVLIVNLVDMFVKLVVMNITVLLVFQEESVFQIVPVLKDNLMTVLLNVKIVVTNVKLVVDLPVIVTHVMNPDFQNHQSVHVHMINI
jgi:hypothetical protein